MAFGTTVKFLDCFEYDASDFAVEVKFITNEADVEMD
jgi:hypothetical protein